MGNLSSTSAVPPGLPAPPRSPAAGSQHSSDESVYETYQVPFGLAKEINRLCSEFHKLQKVVQSGGRLPPQAVFEVDLIQIIQITTPEAGDRPNRKSIQQEVQPSHFNDQRSSRANQDHPPSSAQSSHPKNPSVKFRDPSVPMILKLDKKQLLLLQEASSSNSFSESNALRPSSHTHSSALNGEQVLVAANAGPESRRNGSQMRLAANSEASVGSNPLQKRGLENSGRQQVQPQFLDYANDAAVRSDSRSTPRASGAAATRLVHESVYREYGHVSDDSAPRSDLHFGTPRVNSYSASVHSSDNGGLRSFNNHQTPMSSGSVGFSTASVESHVDPEDTSTYAHPRFYSVQEPGDLELSDADLRVSSPNSVSALLSSQSLVSDDVEAKRKILAEVRFRRSHVPRFFN
jgi:hypothetical protein